jgi:hypothetical protein
MRRREEMEGGGRAKRVITRNRVMLERRPRKIYPFSHVNDVDHLFYMFAFFI